jgi:hypothetical protein
MIEPHGRQSTIYPMRLQDGQDTGKTSMAGRVRKSNIKNQTSKMKEVIAEGDSAILIFAF